MAQDAAAPTNQVSGSNLHLKNILGFQDISNNANGDVSIQDGYLRFQKSETVFAQIPVSSIQELTLGVQDRQVGGVPLLLAKSATPYGGSHVISLFTHKKYDTVTLEYVDANGGFHGAIFQMNKGKGQVLKSELEAAGAQVARVDDKPAKENTQETKNELK